MVSFSSGGSLSLAVALLAGLSVSALSEAGVYRCTNKSGEIYFSDTACPAGFDKEVLSIQNRSGQQSQRLDDDNPYSVINQARMIEAHKQATTLPPIRQGQSAEIRAAPIQQQPVYTYEEARARATKDAGYQKYGHLTKSQKERVHDEMAKYNYLPADHDGSRARALAESAQQSRLDQQRREEQEQHVREVEQKYEKEKRWQEIGVKGREYKYLDAVKDCKETFMANCR